MSQKLFPTILLILDLCASAVCWMGGDWRKGVYWGAAAALTYVVTY